MPACVLEYGRRSGQMANDGQLAERRNTTGTGCVYFLFKMRAAEGDVHAFTRRSRGKFNGEGKEWPGAESWERCGAFDAEGVLREMGEIPGASLKVKRAQDGRPVGIVARSVTGGEKALFGALLGVARSRGLSIAAPERGLLLGTPEEPEKRAEAWMALRKKDLVFQMQKARGLDYLPLGRTVAEWSYVVLPSSIDFRSEETGRPDRFLELAKHALYPDELLVCHPGWLSVQGPNGVYRVNFNWEVRGKHDPRIPDFREPGCPMMHVRRATYRMALRAPKEKSLVDLRLANHRLTERVPHEVVEELKAAKAAGSGTTPQEED